MRIKKIIKAIAYCILAALVLMSTVFGAVSTKRGKAVKALKADVAALTAERDSLRRVNEQLGKEPAVVCTVQFDLRNNAVFGVNNIHAQQVAEQVALYTRQELLALADTLKKAR